MDGSRTVGEIIVDRLEGSGDLDAASVTELVILLRNEGFLEPPPMDAKAALAHRLHPHPGLLERLGVFAKTLRVDWTGADRHVRWGYRSILRPLFTPVGAALTAILAVGGFAAFLVAQSSGRFSIGDANAPLDSFDPAHPGFRPDVRARARPRSRAGALRPPDQECRVHALLRVSGVLRGCLGRADARAPGLGSSRPLSVPTPR